MSIRSFRPSRRSVMAYASIAATAAGLAVGIGPVAAAPADPVTIPDAAFRTCLESLVTGVGLSGGLTEGNLAALSSVSCRSDVTGQTIADLEGAQYLTAAQILDFTGNDIAHVPSLAGLTALRGVYLDDNALTDLDFLAGVTLPAQWTSLSFELRASGNDLTDITGLGAMHLTPAAYQELTFWLVGNQITDISALGTVLTPAVHSYVVLEGNMIADFSPLKENNDARVAADGQSPILSGACQTIELGSVAAGAAVPLVLRDPAAGVGSPLEVVSNATGRPDCWAGLTVDPSLVRTVSLPAGVTWDGDRLIADPSLVGQTVSVLLGSRCSGSPLAAGYCGASWVVTFTVGATLPPTAPPASPGSTTGLAATGMPVGDGLLAAALLTFLGVVLAAAARTRRRVRHAAN